MRKTTALLLISSLALAGCGNSRLNPVNWFGGAQETTVSAEAGNPLIPRQSGLTARAPDVYRGVPVGQITSLVVEPIPGGAIVRVEGVADRQGAYDVQLVPFTLADEPVNGVLAYTLAARLLPRAPVGTPASRQIVAAHYLDEDQLAGTREIRVEGARNALSTRR
ncbi:hypothetical protein [Pseudooceanicola sp. LIPI14-2-Ac024]|uniref:hypothetical protein n=1 Tax=Pseudooceanicola sp. LIPI14-2-Ac024 TaxID=3344875 RepID=UPI0035CEB2B3